MYQKLFHIKKTKKGFTLIELMVVVAIIGILALLGLRIYAGQQDRTKDAVVKANLSTVQTLIQAGFVDNQDQTLAEARTAAAVSEIRNPYSGVDDSGFDTPAEGAVVVTGADGGPFTITGYGKDVVALSNPLTARY